MIFINIENLLKLLPNDFHDSYNVVKVIAIGALINISTGINTSIIFFSKKYKMGLLFLVVLFISTIIFDVLLIPRIGVIGAAIATALSAILYNLLKYFYVKVKFNLNPFNKNIIKLLMVVLVCLTIDFFIPSFSSIIILDMIFRAIISSAIFIFLIFYLKLFDFTELTDYLKKTSN
jgi:hypothetical protein